MHNDPYASVVQSSSFAWFRGPPQVFGSGGPGPGIMGEPSSWQPPQRTIVDVLKSLCEMPVTHGRLLRHRSLCLVSPVCGLPQGESQDGNCRRPPTPKAVPVAARVPLGGYVRPEGSK